MKFGFIYVTINLVNGKIYVGQRRCRSKKLDDFYLGSGKSFQQALKKYGRNVFIKEILEYCNNQEKLSKKEIYWIKYFKSNNRKIGYNMTNGGLPCIISGKRRSLMNKQRQLPNDFGKRVSEGYKNLTNKEKKLKIKRFRNTIKNKSKEEKLKTFKRRSKAQKGKIPWNKNKKGLQIAWNKGKKLK